MKLKHFIYNLLPSIFGFIHVQIHLHFKIQASNTMTFIIIMFLTLMPIYFVVLNYRFVESNIISVLKVSFIAFTMLCLYIFIIIWLPVIIKMQNNIWIDGISTSLNLLGTKYQIILFSIVWVQICVIRISKRGR